MLHIKENVPLAPFTTFRIGGPARYFAEVTSDDEVREALIWARDQLKPYVILSGGSNVLIPDEGLNALVIRIVSSSSEFGRRSLRASAGCTLFAMIRAAAEEELGGWEKLAGIPGSIGGAIRGNAGAFGAEIKDFVTSVRAYSGRTGEIRVFENSKCDFSYRSSFFKKNPEWIIFEIELELNQATRREGNKLISETILEREKRHLQNVQAAGSFFMNPSAPENVQKMFLEEKGMTSRGGRVPAGWLIEKAGMKGAKIGGAVASEQHPNYIVNEGNATAADVLELAKRIKDTVRTKFGVELREEAAIL